MYLYIDCALPECVIFAFGDLSRMKAFRRASYRQEEKRALLEDIAQVLKKAKSSVRDLEGIVVVEGPGQFSFLRTGIVIANTLGFACEIPVLGVPAEERSKEDIQKLFKQLVRRKKFRPIVPLYGREPNITTKKQA